MKKLLSSYPLGKTNLELLKQNYDIDCVPGKKNHQEEVLEMIADYEGLLAIGVKVDKELLDKGEKLEIVSNYGVGYDNIDAEYASKKGVIVCNTPGSTTEPTAELAMGLMLSVMLGVTAGDRHLRNKTQKTWSSTNERAFSLRGKTLGIVGMGRIGKSVAQKAAIFGMNIIYYKRNPLSETEEQQYRATYKPLEELLQLSDVISIHTPLNASTRHLIGKKEFSLMKSSAFLINTARGSVVDEKVLIEALQNKQIRGAGLDVFDKEPTVPDVFLEMENVVITPHIGTATVEGRRNMLVESFSNIVTYFKTGKAPNRVA